MRKHVLAIVLICVMLVGSVPAFASAATDSDKVITFTSPAILVDVGESITLSEYSVMLDAVTTAKASDIRWNAGTASISDGKVTVNRTGVFTLTATVENKSKTVYIVAKDPQDTEYTLFDIDYADYSSVAAMQAAGLRIAEQPDGFTISVADGALKVAGASTHSGSSNARIMLPEWLGDFGNYSISADVKVTSAPTDSRYFSLIYRAQQIKNDYPIYVASFRANTTLNNGHDINYRNYNASNSLVWQSGVTFKHNVRLDNGQRHTLRAEIFDKNVRTFFDGTQLISSDYIGVPPDGDYTTGQLGYFIRGIDVEIYSTRVTLLQNERPDPMADTDAVPSNVIRPASLITYVDSADELRQLAAQDVAPATAVLRVDEKLNVTDAAGEHLLSLPEALFALGGRIIPAFEVGTLSAAEAVGEYAQKNNVYDAFVIAKDGSLVKAAREKHSLLRGVLDFSGRKVEELYSIRKQTNESGARVCILPDDLAHRAATEYLQRLFMTVWVTAGAGDGGAVRAITTGAEGIITEDLPRQTAAFSTFFAKNTMVRTVGAVGHQGLYSGQPNTVASSLEAYRLGATAIENDIYMTTDGVLISIHDNSIAGVTNGTGNVSQMTYDQLQQYVVDKNANAPTQPISTMEDYFVAFKDKDVQLLIEIKSTDIAICKALVDLIDAYEMRDQVNVITFHAAQAAKIKELAPELSVGFLTSSVVNNESDPEGTVFSVLGQLQGLNATYNPSYSKGPLGPELLRVMQDRGIGVFPWTIDSKENLEKYFLYGTKAITTNYASYFEKLLTELYTDQQEYYSADSVMELMPSGKRYDRTISPVDHAELVFVEGDDVFSYSDGKICASGEGSATLMFRAPCNGINGTTYYVVSEPFEITYSESDERIELKLLQQQMADIVNDGNYCAPLWAAFEAARAADADVLSDEQVRSAIADLKGLGPHSFVTRDSGQIATEATCQKRATHLVQCDRCDAVSQFHRVPVGTVAEHAYGKYVSDGNATCCEDGTKTAKCKWCSKHKTVADKGSAKGHRDTTRVFSDVKKGQWYVEAINYNYTHEFIKGVSADRFGVNENVTRGMFITILARIAGVNTNKNNVSTKFADVKAGQYYTAAVKWASENGIVSGTSSTTFDPATPIERQQLCVMIVNFAKYMGIDLKATQREISFRDSKSIDGYAKKAVKTIQKAGIVNGYPVQGSYEFRPKNTASRSEAAQILYKFHRDFF